MDFDADKYAKWNRNHKCNCKSPSTKNIATKEIRLIKVAMSTKFVRGVGNVGKIYMAMIGKSKEKCDLTHEAIEILYYCY